MATASNARRGSILPHSHLRNVSNSSANAASISRPTSGGASSTHSAGRHALFAERRCVLWVHDDVFSKDEVVINGALFRPGSISAGELMTILPVKHDGAARDYSDQTLPADRKDASTAQAYTTDGSETESSRLEQDSANRYFFRFVDNSREIRVKHPKLEISIAKHIAAAFGFKNRQTVLLTLARDLLVTASHVEVSFRKQYLSRNDMWRLVLSELSEKTVYCGQNVLFMGTIKARVTAVYVDGRRAPAAFFSSTTKPVFRSGSAHFVLFVQMSREMWDFDAEGTGEIVFNKVVNGFLPALFKKWEAAKAKHLVTVVLFTRVEYDAPLATSKLGGSVLDTAYHTGIQAEGPRKPFKDFYRVVVSEMASGRWTTILYQLKLEFPVFRRDISMHRLDEMGSLAPPNPPPTLGDHAMGSVPGTKIEAQPSLATHGNILEAINLATTTFSTDYTDRDLIRTGISVVVITPGCGIFEVDYNTLKSTTETLTGNGVGIDLVCLPKMPLHSVPLFRYRNPEFTTFESPTRARSNLSEESTPRPGGMFGSLQSLHTPRGSLSPTKASVTEAYNRLARRQSEWNYAVPHWIDVSFWTGASQDLLARPGAPLGTDDNKIIYPAQQEDFQIRCRMTELEIACNADNKDLVEVEPLVDDPLFPRTLLGIRNQMATEAPVINFLPGRKPHGGLSSLAWPPPRVHDRQLAQSEKDFYKALDACDMAWSKPMKARVKRSRPDDFALTTTIENPLRESIEEDEALSTSFRTEQGDSAVTIAPSTPSSKIEFPIEFTRRESTASSSSKTSNSTRSKDRKISFGLRGFGIAAPKAAMAELMTEHIATAQLTTSKGRERSFSSAMANHLLLASSMPRLASRASSQGDRKSVKDSAENAPEHLLATQPITVKSALQTLESDVSKSRSILGSVYEGVDPSEGGDGHSIQKARGTDSQRIVQAKLRAGSTQLPTLLSPVSALSPWLTVLNPTNPPGRSNEPSMIPTYKRWQHIYPQPNRVRAIKWKSLTSPAAVPLTTEEFPTKLQLEKEYQQHPYNVSRDFDESLTENSQRRQEFLMELIGLRLCQGFQVVVGPAVAGAFGQKTMKIANILDRNHVAEDGMSVFMSMGHVIHQLSCINGTEIEVNTYTRKPSASQPRSSELYRPAIRTTLQEQYLTRHIRLNRFKDECNWNYVDSFVGSQDEDVSDQLRFWRARFVLIPADRPTKRYGEDDDEEIRLEGIRKLTQLWQRNRYIPPSERRYMNASKSKDTNPLDITYRTQDPSIVIESELETLPLLETGNNLRRGQLLSAYDPFRRAKLDIHELADAIQEPVEKGGVPMRNRLWHWRYHYNCFIGSDMTTWILENFDDIDTREEAVELGNSLMAKSASEKQPHDPEKEDEARTLLFMHVEGRHPFRDGQYFYQIVPEFSKHRPETRGGWFGSRRRDPSIPSTPHLESAKDSPRPDRSRASSGTGDRSSDSGATTPTLGPTGKRPRVQLSKMIKYNVDSRKRSYRSEKINLHYDRLHHPDNCYHVRIEWMNVTAKLIEDAVTAWAMEVEPYGLQLVEVPVTEACDIPESLHFRDPTYVKLAVLPPEQSPEAYYNPTLNQLSHNVRHYYQKAILKKHGFVLDLEAARDFPSSVDVTYSWPEGRPDYKYTQFIHKSGVLLAEIMDDGHFLLMANALYNNRTAVGREMTRKENIDRSEHLLSSSHHFHGSDRATPVSSPALRPQAVVPPESPVLKVSADVFTDMPHATRFAANAGTNPVAIKDVLEAFCASMPTLEAFYRDVRDHAHPPAVASPSFLAPHRSPFADAHIPALGLPPGVLSRENTPSPLRLASGSSTGTSSVGGGTGNGNGNGSGSGSGSGGGNGAAASWASSSVTAHMPPPPLPSAAMRKSSVPSLEAWLGIASAASLTGRESSTSGEGSQSGGEV